MKNKYAYRFNLKLGDNNISLTLEEIIELKSKLDEIFGKGPSYADIRPFLWGNETSSIKVNTSDCIISLQDLWGRENPFYYNYVFSKKDLNRPLINPWKYPFLWFLRTLVQISDGYVFYYKLWKGKIFLMNVQSIDSLSD